MSYNQNRIKFELISTKGKEIYHFDVAKINVIFVTSKQCFIIPRSDSLRSMENVFSRHFSFLFRFFTQTIPTRGCCNSSVDSSAPSILPPRVRVPSTPSMLFQFILFKLYICQLNSNVKRTKINKKEAGITPFLKHNAKKYPSSFLQPDTNSRPLVIEAPSVNH